MDSITQIFKHQNETILNFVSKNKDLDKFFFAFYSDNRIHIRHGKHEHTILTKYRDLKIKDLTEPQKNSLRNFINELNL